MYRLLIFVMLAAAVGFGQQRGSRPAPATRWPIETMAVEGNRIYSAAQVLGVTGLKIGQVAGKPEFDAARDRLVATGAFETVSYKFVPSSGGKGYAATFQVTEVEQSYPVRFEDLKVSELDLAAALQARDPLFASMRVPATQPVLERYVHWIEEYLSAHDQQVKVTGSVALVAPGEFAVVFRPAGDLPVVALVTFRGNNVVPQNVLHEAISGAAVGTPYTEDRFRDILRSSIRPIYEARGRLRVSFPEVRAEPTTDVKGLHVYVTVNEGESYNFGEIRIDGELPVSAESLLKASNLKPGDMANFDKLNEGLENIRKAVRHAGFMDAKVAADHKIDEGKKAVDVTVHVDPGQQYITGKLNIVGLDLSSEAEVKRIWTLTEGKPFNPDYPDFFLNRIREENVFDHLGPTRSDIHVDPKRRVVDVTLTFSGDAGQPGGRGRGGRGGRGGR